MAKEQVNTLALDKVKALGAPFEKAEVQVSLQKKTARLVLCIRGQKGNLPAMDFQLDGNEDWQQVGNDLTAAAFLNGLLRVYSEVAIVNLDSGPVN
jgi:hypothetical protein